MDGMKQATAPAVPARATRGAETRWSWVEASVWTERMVSALDNGVKGGRWYSLMASVAVERTISAGPTHSSRKQGCSHFTRLG